MSKVKNGKKLGVLAGMGPAAGAEFLRLLTIKSPASTDQEHPVVYLLSETEIPDRSPAILGLGADPQQLIYNALQRLSDMGADILACPCNSAHYFIDRFSTPLTQPLIHIVEETVLAAKAKSPQGAWMISTLGTLQSGLYQQYADRHNYKLYLPSSKQAELIQQCIVQIKAGELAQASKVLTGLVQELWLERDILVMTACTELPLAYSASELPASKSVSSLEALAAACVRELFCDS